MKGIDRFLSGHREFTETLGDHEKGLLKELAGGQKPEAVVISCSDSRVIPELITNAGPGALFVVRNIANLIPPHHSGNQSVGAALDYAIRVLGVSHLVVLGHYGCGGMLAVRDLFAGGGGGAHDHSHPLPGWLAYGRDSWDELVAAGLQDDPAWHDRLVEENVLQQLANALDYASVAEAVRAGKLVLHAWVYDLAHGRIRFWDAHTRRFVEGEGTGAMTEGQVRAENHA